VGRGDSSGAAARTFQTASGGGRGSWVCLICSRRNEDLDSHCATCSRARGMTPTPRSGERPARLGGGGSAGGKSKGESHIAHTPQKQRRNRLYAALEAADDENHTREEMTAEIVGLELGALHKETVLKRKQWQGARADEAKCDKTGFFLSAFPMFVPSLSW
jgi:hypothetical protein